MQRIQQEKQQYRSMRFTAEEVMIGDLQGSVCKSHNQHRGWTEPQSDASHLIGHNLRNDWPVFEALFASVTMKHSLDVLKSSPEDVRAF
eukprot:746762-Hanusia_phi.AAC.6